MIFMNDRVGKEKYEKDGYDIQYDSFSLLFHHFPLIARDI